MQKTVLVTGASRGIGREIAVRFAKAGYNVAVNYCSHEAEAMQTVAMLNAMGGLFRVDNAAAFRADVSDPAQVEEMFTRIHGTFGGGVDLLVNNAGVAQQKLLQDVSPEEWDRLFGVNVKGMYLCARQALPDMIRRQSGNIINVSSMWGQVGASCEVAYSAAKAAVIGFTKALAKEVGPSGIQVNCVAPGFISTEMNAALAPEAAESLRQETPLERLGTPRDVANAVWFLASQEAGFITGQVLGVNGGLVV